MPSRSPAPPAAPPVTLDALTARLGASLRARRAAAGLTQEQVAERSRVGLRSYRRLEAGQVDTRLDMLCAVASGLGCDPADLFAVPA